VHYASMERLSRLAVDTLCLGHTYSCTGNDARQHMAASLVQSRRFRHIVERFLTEEKGDIQAVMQRVKAVEWDGKSALRQPEPAYVLNLEARIKAVLRKWRAGRTGTPPEAKPL
jgi:2-aminobenzoylacetyl-CoA thioesterase